MDNDIHDDFIQLDEINLIGKWALEPQRYSPSGEPSCFLYNTFSLAFLKSSVVTFILRSRRARSPASVHMACKVYKNNEYTASSITGMIQKINYID